jgi:hypothetical protein
LTKFIVLGKWHLDYLIASAEESVGEIWFRQGAEVVMKGRFVGFLRAESVGSSGDQF